MADELVVARVVRMMAEYVFPDDQVLIDAVVSAAVKAYWSGASVSEACRVGQGSIAGHLAGRLVDQVA